MSRLSDNVDMDKETKDLLEEMKRSNGYISIAELVERFEEIDEYYNHESWNLKQILSNINIIIPVKISDLIKAGGTNE